MKIINCLLLSLFILAACSKKEVALQPSNKDENYLVVRDNPNDLIDHEVYQIFKATGIPIFYNDTIARRQVGDSAGIPQYFYIRLMANYSPSTGPSNSLAFTLLPKNRRSMGMLNLVKSDLLTVLPPFPSIFLTDSLYTPSPGSKIIRDAQLGFNTVVIRSVITDTMSVATRNSFVLSVLTRIATQKLEAQKSTELENQFYFISRSLSPWLDPFHVLLAQISDGTQTFEDFGFITTVKTGNKIYSPEKSRDLDSYLRAVFSNTPANFKAQYANYPPVLQKFDVLRNILTGMKFKLPQ